MLNPYVQESKAKYERFGEIADLRLLPDQERRTYKIPRALFKEIQGFGRTDASSCAVFAAHRLKWHEPQYNRFPLLYSITLERELR